MVRLDDVAKFAGVSKNTASRVLNNRGYISAETRQKVMHAIKELNYHPNETARNLLKGKYGLIGLLVPNISTPYYAEIIDIVEKELMQRDYKLLLCNSSHNMEIEQKFLKMFQSCRVEGLILCDHDLSGDDYANMTFPIVSVDRYVRKGVSFICSNHRLGGKLAAEEILRCGCKNVLQVSGSREQATTWNERHIVFEKLLREQNVICNTLEVERFSRIHDFAVIKELLHEKLDEISDCDAFFGGDLWAVAALQEAIARGKSVPKNFKIIGYDGTPYSEIVTPPITTIRTHADKIAIAAVDTVCRMIDGVLVGTCKIEFDVELIRRKSTQAVIKKSKC